MSKIDDKYDAIIIGAGVGGLVCGNYLAKKGLKVLIAEQHYKPGGYCSSFEKGNCVFDSAIHSLGSFRDQGQLRAIYNELELEKKLNILRFDPINLIIFPQHYIKIYNDNQKTLHYLQEDFPNEAYSLKRFFDYILKTDFISVYINLKDKTFRALIDSYFKDNRLKSILSSVLINMGFPSYNASALSAFYQYKEFMFDGGYYPSGGMQKFSDSLAKNFEELGGKIIYSNSVKKIILKEKNVKGVILENKTEFISKIVISNCDSYQTFFNFVGEENIPPGEVSNLKELMPSPSAFIVYLALASKIHNLKESCNIWYFEDYDIDRVFSSINDTKTDIMNDIIFCGRPSSHDKTPASNDKEIIFLISLAPYLKNKFLEDNKEIIADKMIKKIQKFFGGINDKIIVKEIATPFTLYKYTKNYRGASFGLGSIPSQIRKEVLPQRCRFIKGLYSVGHWSTGGAGQGGVSFSAASGRNLAKLIIKDLKKQSLDKKSVWQI